MDIEDSFIYTVASDEKKNAGLNNFYTIDFGGFNTEYDEFRVEIINCVLSGSVNQALGYVMLIADNFATDGVFCSSKLNNNECILATIPTNVDVLMTNGGIFFKIKNYRQPKEVVFSLIKSNFFACASGTDINLGAVETKWVLTLKMTGIPK